MGFEVRGLDSAQRRIDTARKRWPTAQKKAAREVILYVQDQFYYPAQRPNSTYTRTFQLFESLTNMQGQAKYALSRVSLLNDKVQSIWGTRRPGAKYVVNEGTQARMHRGWWFTMQSLVDLARKEVKEIYKGAILDSLGKFTFKG